MLPDPKDLPAFYCASTAPGTAASAAAHNAILAGSLLRRASRGLGCQLQQAALYLLARYSPGSLSELLKLLSAVCSHLGPAGRPVVLHVDMKQKPIKALDLSTMHSNI